MNKALFITAHPECNEEIRKEKRTICGAGEFPQPYREGREPLLFFFVGHHLLVV